MKNWELAIAMAIALIVIALHGLFIANLATRLKSLESKQEIIIERVFIQDSGGDYGSPEQTL